MFTQIFHSVAISLGKSRNFSPLHSFSFGTHLICVLWIDVLNVCGICVIFIDFVEFFFFHKSGQFKVRLRRNWLSFITFLGIWAYHRTFQRT